MGEAENPKELSWRYETEGLYIPRIEPDKNSRKPAGSRRWVIFVLLVVLLGVLAGLQIWGAGEFQRGVSGIKEDVQKISERLGLLENTAGEQNILAFLNDVESLSKECRQETQAVEKLKQQWWFVLPFLKRETVSQDLLSVQKKLTEMVAVRPTVEAFARRLRETDNNIVGVLEAIGTADVESMIVELASFKEDSEGLRRDIERTQWPTALEPFKESFVTALDERDAALDALLSALASAAKASDFAEQAVSTYMTAWSIWDYQQVLNYLEASDAYSSQAEGYLAEFEFHTARYLKIRDRLIENSPVEGETSKGSRV